MELWRGSYFLEKISSVWMFLGAKLVLMAWIHGVYAGTKKTKLEIMRFNQEFTSLLRRPTKGEIEKYSYIHF
ncbi:hypothetical protein QYZ44_01255 [Vibrio parahaemolyticus]|nr:hypothetical protein [Vibrio parahaemolyticus]MDN4708755.1 hypothetical protein [Vibrio parahaemolyticus]